MKRLLWSCASLALCLLAFGSAPAVAQGTACDSPCKVIPLPLTGARGAVCDSPCKLILLPLISQRAQATQTTLPFVIGTVDTLGHVARLAAGPAYFEYQVDKPAKDIAGTGVPQYPDSLKRAKIEGEVVVSFIVDTLGVAVPNTFRILRSTHPLFAAAVREALPQMRFVPAELNGAKVREILQRPFVFSIAH